MRKVLTITMLGILSGCTSIPKDAPPYRSAPIANDNSGTLYIYRVGAYPTLRTPSIFVDSNKIIDPPEKAYTWIYLSPGNHSVTVDWAWDTGWPDLSFEIPIEAGKEHFLKITGSFENLGLKYRAGSEALYMEKSIAEKELKECCRYIIPANKQSQLDR
ncbi:DUF2846 domain-containing protein [Grimontia kaedaensis]|uniref:DUF2846 domain-containing protein n=1 Tax=Grimontia kaedaensis TaxID=2872157 RepID=A0ABY4X1N5_9GAMM|nr:DUF2846 domain-containing protein [Grimontia kaedaensis]USH05159.1 DUF2846 domain-containing protein [Grimontia kaedaensis]